MKSKPLNTLTGFSRFRESFISRYLYLKLWLIQLLYCSGIKIFTLDIDDKEKDISRVVSTNNYHHMQYS